MKKIGPKLLVWLDLIRVVGSYSGMGAAGGWDEPVREGANGINKFTIIFSRISLCCGSG